MVLNYLVSENGSYVGSRDSIGSLCHERVHACLEQATSITPEVFHDPVQNALTAFDDPDTVRLTFSLDLASCRISTSPASHATSSSTISPAFQTPRASWTLAQRISTSQMQNAPATSFINFVKFAEQCTPFVANLRDQSTKKGSRSPRNLPQSDTNLTCSSKCHPRRNFALEQTLQASNA